VSTEVGRTSYISYQLSSITMPSINASLITDNSIILISTHCTALQSLNLKCVVVFTTLYSTCVSCLSIDSWLIRRRLHHTTTITRWQLVGIPIVIIITLSSSIGRICITITLITSLSYCPNIVSSTPDSIVAMMMMVR